MTITVLDSNDLPAILVDAGATLEQPIAEAKPEKAEEEALRIEDADDIEGEDGLTLRQKRELTDKMQKAIGKKHRALKEAEEFAAEQYNTRLLAERRAEEMERELEKLRSKKTMDQPEIAEKPQRQNFATESDYIDAMIQFGVDQRLMAQREQDAKDAADRAQAQIIEAAKGRIQKAIELVPDYQDVVGSVDLVVPPAVAGYMQKSEMFAELGYHLAKNQDILVLLAKLPADEQLVKIGKIESTLKPFAAKETYDDSKSSTTNSKGQEKPAQSDPMRLTPSKARGNEAPVITPLDGAATAGLFEKDADMNIRKTIQEWSKRNQVNLGQRKRH